MHVRDVVLIMTVCLGSMSFAMDRDAARYEALLFAEAKAPEAIRQEYDALSARYRCLVCQNQSLSESSAPLAIDLRWQILRLLKAGQGADAIDRYLVSRYGHFIQLMPIWSWQNAALYVMPWGVLIAALFVIRRLARAK